MSENEKKPNILECNGLIIRGRDGEVRAEIGLMDRGSDGREAVYFDLFGDKSAQPDGGPPEPVACLMVDPDGSSMLDVSYSGLVDGRVDTKGGIGLVSGDHTTPPRLTIWGRGGYRDDLPILELPDLSAHGHRAALMNEVLTTVHRYESEHGMDVDTVGRVLNDVEMARRREAGTEVSL